jgi:lysozyme
MRAALSSAGILALASLAACAMETRGEPVGHSSEAVVVCAKGPVVKGLDVSSYQGSGIAWPQVKAAGYDFAIARISDGSYLDTDFAANWKGMKAAGMVRGSYQYFEPGESPSMQANIVIAAVGKLGPGDLPVTADMETTGGQSAATIAANLQTWAAAVEAGTGKTPMIYTAEGYWNGSVGSTAFVQDPLWVANWGVTCPGLPNGWKNWVFWQTAGDSTSVGGVSGADPDVFNGTLAQLQAFAGSSVGPTDGGTGVYAASFVSQSWSFASTPMAMTTCETIPASITLRNTGTKTWDSHTRLATTQPRDRVSLFADSTWVYGDRAAQVTGTVPPGGTFDFKFDFHAPPTPGTYKEYFGVVEDGVAWFSDPGQGGPPDDQIEADIAVTAGATNCVADPGVPEADAGDDGGTDVDAGPVVDAGGGGDEGPPRVDFAAETGFRCACSTGRSRGGPGWTVYVLILAAFARINASRRRR